MDYKLLFISVCVVHLSMHCQGRPLRKRTVSEVQFMHNLGERRQLQERRDWLQTRLRGVHTAAAARDAARDASSEEAKRLRRSRLGVEVLPQLQDLTPQEVQHALNFLEKLLKSKQS